MPPRLPAAAGSALAQGVGHLRPSPELANHLPFVSRLASVQEMADAEPALAEAAAGTTSRQCRPGTHCQGRQPGTPVANAGTHGCSRGALGHTTLVERETRGGAGGGSSITVQSPEPLRRGGGAAALSAWLRMRLTPGITPCACSTPAECLALDDVR